MAKDSGPTVVTLVDPNGGGECNVSDVTSLNSLHFGHGYSFKDKSLTADKALALLAGQAEALAAPPAAPPAPPAGGKSS